MHAPKPMWSRSTTAEIVSLVLQILNNYVTSNNDTILTVLQFHMMC